MAIPQICTVGGFSMCSTPEQLQKEGTLDLAVKYSKHPPADWVHTKCKEGTVLMVRSGGDVFYDPGPSEPPHDLLLIAGGIGINPLHSIFSHVSDQSKRNNSVAEKVQLLYSAVTEDELIFKSDIEDMASKNSQLRCQFHVTKGESNIGCKAGRINEEDIKETFKWLNKDHTKTYICGPSPMIADIENILVKLGLNKKSIFYEKWW